MSWSIANNDYGLTTLSSKEKDALWATRSIDLAAGPFTALFEEQMSSIQRLAQYVTYAARGQDHGTFLSGSHLLCKLRVFTMVRSRKTHLC